MIPQDPVSVSVVAFLLAIAVGTAWLMVGRQAWANSGWRTARSDSSGRAGVLIGNNGIPGVDAGGASGSRRLPVRTKGHACTGRKRILLDADQSRGAHAAGGGVASTVAGEALGGQAMGVKGAAAGSGEGNATRTERATGRTKGNAGRSAPLSSDQQWSRITQIVQADIESAHRADDYHAAANQQLDAVDYAIARLREEMESISAGGRGATRQREASGSPAARTLLSGAVPLMGTSGEDVAANNVSTTAEKAGAKSPDEQGSEPVSVRETAADHKKPAGKASRARRGKPRRTKEKSIAA